MPFLERLDHLFVIQAIGRRVVHALAVGERDAAPAADHGDEVRRLARRRGARALGADRAAVRQELVQDAQLLRDRTGRARAPSPRSRDQRLVAIERLLDLHRVVGHQLGRGIDAGQAAADDDRRQARLQVRQRVALERAGQLQRHQEVAGLADAADQVVLHVDDGRAGRRRRRSRRDRMPMSHASSIGSVPPKRTPP